MLFVRYALDGTASPADRQDHLEAHKAFLRSGRVNVLQSGPLLAGDGTGAKIGALVVFECADAEEAAAFSAADPFVVAGVYGQVILHEWHRTIG